MPVKFYLSSTLNRFGEAAIKGYFNIGNKNYVRALGLSVEPSAWNNGDWRCAEYKNSKGLSGEELGRRLDVLDRRVHAVESALDGRLTAKELRIMVADLLDRMNLEYAPVLMFLDRFIQEQSLICQWSKGTSEGFQALRKHLQGFNADADLEFFNAAGLDRWLIYLRTQGLEESTVKKLYQLLRWFLLWAIRNGHTQERGAQNYRPKFKLVRKPVIYLTARELARLYRMELPTGSTLAVVRDGFCLCALTSLRYSDLSKLRKTDISGKMIWITTQKTRDRLPIDLNPAARAIIDKYANVDLPGGKAIPVISNQKMNVYLKKLCRLCGINSPVTKVCYRGGRREEKIYAKWELVGTHAARRTFICFALENGIPPQVIMKWTGHSDYHSMRPYIEISERAKAQAMRKLSSAWEGLAK